MKMIIKLGVILLAVVTASVHAQMVAQETGAHPQEPPPAGGQTEPAPAETSDNVLNVPEAAPEVIPTAGSVARSVFTSGIQDREPVDQLTEVTAANDKVYFFTELKDLDGQTVKHRWLYAGQVVAEVTFPVGGARWRVWSSKALPADQLGTWTVEVVNGGGKVIASSTIEHKGGPAQPPVPLASESEMGVAAGQ